ncbi:YjjG family noncanonical pyrimidine nucleotidase [Hominifimenecus sp. rT4P-3]|uniref:YjjG family noncanonical pyrimidine nucleotidase n=1 Tax=Hominifimenecus sp. rT4P-3 TaxID=3242979 RepID=UPI003DA65FD8
MRAYDWIFFDADGTLLDFATTERHALERTFRQFGYPFDEAIRKRYEDINHGLWKDFERGRITKDDVLNNRFSRLFREIGVVRGENDRAFEKAYQDALAEGTDVTEGAEEVLSYLKGKYFLYVATNGVASTQYKRLRQSGLARYFDGIFVSEEIGFQKPQKEYFSACFAKIPGIIPERTLIVGDSLTSDMAGGQAAGMATCWFHGEEEANTEDLPITMEIRRLTELKEIL